MNRLVLWASLLVILISLNIYLGWYSDSISNIELNEQSSVIAEEIEPFQTPQAANIQDSKIKLIFTGDVMLGRTVMTKSKEVQDYYYPFRKTADLLKQADLTIINLENPIINNCPVHTGGFIFCSEPESASALEFAGVDIVNLANNHTYNWGNEGFVQTITYLTESGVDSVGYSNIVFRQIEEMIIAFVGFDFVTNPYTLDEAEVEMIKSADLNSDILIANIHWGNEYHDSANQHQRNMAAELVRSGVDLIVGHHPHWVQDADCFSHTEKVPQAIKNIKTEQLKNGEGCPEDSIPVYYSLGNFVFDQMWSEETRKGGILVITLQDKKIVNEEFLPTYMSSWAQPEWAEEQSGF